MNRKELVVYSIIVALIGILVFGAAAAQATQRVTDSAPVDRPPFERQLVEPPAVPAELPEGIHLLEGPRRLILQDLNVVILMADDDGAQQEVADYLLASGHVLSVDHIDVRNMTPALPDIEGYDAVLTWSNYWYDDPVGMGDLLADYMDLGKGVITLNFAHYSNAGLEGRFMAEYSPFVHGDNTYVDVSLGTYNPDHPLMTDVSAVTEYYAVDVGVAGVGTCVAWWDNDWPFVAYNHDNNRAVGINGYVGGLYRVWTGDMLQVVLNSVLFVTGGMPEACQLSKCGEPYYYFDQFWAGDQIVTFFDAASCPGSPTYPFAITSFDFQLTALNGWYPVDVDIVVLAMADPNDFCQGPGDELCRFTYTCDESFEYPNVGSAPFPEPCCVEGPFFIGIEYRDPIIAYATYDFGPPVECDVWWYSTSDWIEWYAFWGGETGYPIVWVNGETYSPDCQEQQVPTLSEWGMLIMSLLILTAGTIAIVRRRKLALGRDA